MPKLTVKDLLELKGVRQIAFVQIKNAQIVWKTNLAYWNRN